MSDTLIKVFQSKFRRTPNEAESRVLYSVGSARDVLRWVQIIQNADDSLDVTKFELPPLPDTFGAEHVGDVEIPPGSTLIGGRKTEEQKRALREQVIASQLRGTAAAEAPKRLGSPTNCGASPTHVHSDKCQHSRKALEQLSNQTTQAWQDMLKQRTKEKLEENSKVKDNYTQHELMLSKVRIQQLEQEVQRLRQLQNMRRSPAQQTQSQPYQPNRTPAKLELDDDVPSDRASESKDQAVERLTKENIKLKAALRGAYQQLAGCGVLAAQIQSAFKGSDGVEKVGEVADE